MASHFVRVSASSLLRTHQLRLQVGGMLAELLCNTHCFHQLSCQVEFRSGVLPHSAFGGQLLAQRIERPPTLSDLLALLSQAFLQGCVTLGKFIRALNPRDCLLCRRCQALLQRGIRIL